MSRMVIAAALALAVTLPAAPAHAQAIRTFVSIAGSDSNPCSITQPCRHFQAAVNATALGGEVDALDAGAYGSFSIGQAISIEGQGWSYVAPPANGAAITIAASSSDNIFIHGVSLNGVGVTSANGIHFTGGASLTVRDSVIRNFTIDGIVFEPTSSTSNMLSVLNTLVSDNGHHGIGVFPLGSGTTTGVFDHVQMENNAAVGLSVATPSAPVNVTVNDSVSSNNLDGITVSAGSEPVSVLVRNSTIANNSNNGLETDSFGAAILITRSTITANGTGWAVIGGGVATFGDNDIFGNGSANNAPTSVAHE